MPPPMEEVNGDEQQQQQQDSNMDVVTELVEKLAVTQQKTESWPSLDEVEELFGYKFKNRSLLEEAFTDTSLPGKNVTYDRLEYIGDSVLSLLITKDQYYKYPELTSGPLTKLRSVNVDTEKLARVALKHGLDKYLRHKRPVLGDQIRDFMEEIAEYPLHSNGLIDGPKVLADIVESSIGAVFIDSNSSLDTVWQVFKRLLEPIISPIQIGNNPKAELYELCQKHGWKIGIVTDLGNKKIEIFVEDQLMGRAELDLKKKIDIAKNRAAKDALNKLEKIISDSAISDHDHCLMNNTQKEL